MKNIDKVLEVGCGTGESSKRIGSFFKNKHFEVSEYEERYVSKLKETEFPYKVTQSQYIR